MQTITIRTHQDAIAAVPHLLGFHPTESLVLMPFSSHLPVVRVDIPTTVEDRDSLWEESLRDALGPHVVRTDAPARMAAMCFTQDRSTAEVTSRDIAQRLGGIGIGVPVRLWTNGSVWSEFNTGDSGRCSQKATDLLAATGVVAGRVRPAVSREAMAATLVGDREPVAAQLEQAYITADTPAAERGWALERLDQFLDDGTRLTDHDAARLLVAVQTTSTRDALWEEMTLESAVTHQSLWVDMTRRAPDEVRAPAATMAAFASWLHGDGAKAWCALDQVPTDQNYPMAALVAEALHGGLPPSEWEGRRRLTTSPATESDLEDLDESYTPKAPGAREPGQVSSPEPVAPWLVLPGEVSTVTPRSSSMGNEQPTPRPTSRLDLPDLHQRVQEVTDPRMSVVCPQSLGGLPCMNHQPHPGDGRGCVHYSSSGVPDRHDLGDDE